MAGFNRINWMPLKGSPGCKKTPSFQSDHGMKNSTSISLSKIQGQACGLKMPVLPKSLFCSSLILIIGRDIKD